MLDLSLDLRYNESIENPPTPQEPMTMLSASQMSNLKLTEKEKAYTRAVWQKFHKDTVGRKEFNILKDEGYVWPGFFLKPDYRVSNGLYKMPVAAIEDIETGSTGEALDLSRQVGRDAAARMGLEVSGDAPKTKALRRNRKVAGEAGFFMDVETDATVNENDAAEPASVVSNLHEVAAASLPPAYFPQPDPNYVPWGHYNMLKKVLESNEFLPIFITGQSGNGKTMGVMEACAAVGRSFVNVSVTEQTDEDDLLGGFRLKNNENGDSEMVFDYGPVCRAMLQGSALLLDEIDLGGSRMMCIQPIMNGESVYLKKINKVIHPAPGFMVIATANTKGLGDDTSKFMHTSPMNEALLDRFPITIMQKYPTAAVEKKILAKILDSRNVNPKVYAPVVDQLIDWAGHNRSAYEQSAVDFVITTRRLVAIAKMFTVLQSDIKAIELGVSRFDEETARDLILLYKKLTDANVKRMSDEKENQFKKAEKKNAGEATPAASSAGTPSSGTTASAPATFDGFAQGKQKINIDDLSEGELDKMASEEKKSIFENMTLE